MPKHTKAVAHDRYHTGVQFGVTIPVTWNFDSLDEMTEYGDTNRVPGSDSSQTQGSRWHGTESWDEAKEFATRGWPKGTELIYRMREEMGLHDVSQLVGEAEIVVNDVMGGAVDMDYYLEGEPECMLCIEETVANNPRVITICVNAMASCVVTTEELERRGAATGVVVDALESMGIQCEIIMFAYNSWVPAAFDDERCGKGFLLRTLIKKGGEPLDLDRVAYALVSASFLRRHVFAVMESQPDVPGGYGMPWSIEPEEVLQAHIMVPTMSGHRAEWIDDQSAIEWIKKALAPFMEVD